MRSQVRRYTLAGLLMAAALFGTSIRGEAVTSVFGETRSLEGVVSSLWTAGLRSPLGTEALGLFLGVASSSEGEPTQAHGQAREPASLLLLATGLAGAAAYVRRRLNHVSRQ